MKLYSVVYVDPPWDYKQAGAIRMYKGTRRARADAHYQTMNLPNLIAMKPLVIDLCEDDVILAMWGTWPKLDEYMQLGRGWGFEWLTAAFVWVKVSREFDEDQGALFLDETKTPAWTGLGFYTRGNTEFCGFWRRGKPPLPEDRTVRQVIHAPRREHSRKPDEARRRLEQLWPDAARIELFARESSPRWDTWGNEVTKFDDRLEGLLS